MLGLVARHPDIHPEKTICKPWMQKQIWLTGWNTPLLRGGFKYFFHVHPDFVGKWIQFEEHILWKMGCFNHQLALLFFVVRVVVFSPLSGGGVLTLLDLDKKVPAKISPLCWGKNGRCFVKKATLFSQEGAYDELDISQNIWENQTMFLFGV